MTFTLHHNGDANQENKQCQSEKQCKYKRERMSVYGKDYQMKQTMSVGKKQCWLQQKQCKMGIFLKVVYIEQCFVCHKGGAN